MYLKHFTVYFHTDEVIRKTYKTGKRSTCRTIKYVFRKPTRVSVFPTNTKMTESSRPMY